MDDVARVEAASDERAGPPSSRHRLIALLGPAFVAAIAYVDPGNVAVNVTAGSRYGDLLLWVLVVSSVMAALVQYQSAKVGIVTGDDLPTLLGDRLSRPVRIGFWLQAEIVAAATDVAEVIGGALAVYLLTGMPLPIAGLLVGAVSLTLLGAQGAGHRAFEIVMVSLLAVVSVGFVAVLAITGTDPGQLVAGLVPRFEGAQSVVLAAGMLGATVMPHAIYLHSSLSTARRATVPTGVLLRATRWDVGLALSVAGGVNVAMLLLASGALRGRTADSIIGAHASLALTVGPLAAVFFAVGLLASGLASTSVGSYAGAVVMSGLLHIRVPLLARRTVTLVPAVLLLAVGVDPTAALVISQVLLSVGIPFALIPLVRLAGDRRLMGGWANGRGQQVVLWVVVGLVVALNVALIVLTITGA